MVQEQRHQSVGAEVKVEAAMQRLRGRCKDIKVEANFQIKI